MTRRIPLPGAAPADLLAESYDYLLPDGLIAQSPIEPRDAARMMVVPLDGGEIVHTGVNQLPAYLRPGDLLVFNNTKVFPARLLGTKPSGGAVEFLLLRPLADGTWLSMVRPGKRLRPGQRVVFGPNGELEAVIVAATPTGERIVRFQHEGNFWDLLELIGEVPLPPYIGEKLQDKDRYNTVYAQETGSVAAPTAGLHFTPELLAALEAQGVAQAHITLHVGIGTFRPVSTDNILDHPMHAETYVISEATAALLRAHHRQPGRRIVAVGTTVVRTLESVMHRFGALQACQGETDIFIYPGYAFQAIDGLMTNFHLPKSTLLMMISSLAGRERILSAYPEAVAQQYRFFSFGDSCLFV
ncbi:MAG: tRNA preQ1(34) S-adenosylmethionine ribosyltransferase-isomerase QueA [Candidatus Sericytochromatia bacterium]|nr:tRNA preQ1(34) S-adenosylmethionine ribosyltransferase-isomerase QueA [Candidatus Sericytochromatia bacterium]